MRPLQSTISNPDFLSLPDISEWLYSTLWSGLISADENVEELRHGVADVALITPIYMRGGMQAPLAPAELERKFLDNAVYGGWSKDDAAHASAWCARLFAPDAIAECASFRH